MPIDSPAGRRPRLTPAVADIRRAVRAALSAAVLAENPVSENAPVSENDGVSSRLADRQPPSPGESGENSVVFRHGSVLRGEGGVVGRAGALVLVGLSGGADSLALAAAAAFEGPRAGLRVGAVVVDHGLQLGSAEVAARAALQAAGLGLDPVLVRRVEVSSAGGSESGGPEAAARDARYRALDAARRETGAVAILLGHTMDDQAETVLLGLARGSGATSLTGMLPVNGFLLRPLLGIRRRTTVQACLDAGLEPWNDPHNDDPSYARVRVRTRVLPVLEAELGPGVADALARTAEQLREDSDALDRMVEETIEEIVEHAEAGIAISAAALAANPPALRHRIIRYVVHSEFGVSLSRAQTLAVAALVTDWHGQKGVDLPGIRVVRNAGRLVFSAATAS